MAKHASKTRTNASQKLYRNAGASPLVFEGIQMEPGDEFYVTLDPVHETQLIQGGSLEILKDQSAEADRLQEEEAASGGVVAANPERVERSTTRRGR